MGGLEAGVAILSLLWGPYLHTRDEIPSSFEGGLGLTAEDKVAQYRFWYRSWSSRTLWVTGRPSEADWQQDLREPHRQC